jgi:hypothetical protein
VIHQEKPRGFNVAISARAVTSEQKGFIFTAETEVGEFRVFF